MRGLRLHISCVAGFAFGLAGAGRGEHGGENRWPGAARARLGLLGLVQVVVPGVRLKPWPCHGRPFGGCIARRLRRDVSSVRSFGRNLSDTGAHFVARGGWHVTLLRKFGSWLSETGAHFVAHGGWQVILLRGLGSKLSQPERTLSPAVDGKSSSSVSVCGGASLSCSSTW